MKTHNIHSEVIQMHSSWIKHTFPILSGKGAENNIRILTTFALNRPLSKYDLSKILNVQYPTIHRRVEDLTNRNYLAIADERVQEKRRDQKTLLYSITWKGLIISLQIKNPWLPLPLPSMAPL